jgi:hypothetical protein
VLIRGAASVDTSANRIAPDFSYEGDDFAGLERLSSMKEFQSLQSGQRPSHLAEVYPQLWHSKIVGALVILFPTLEIAFSFSIVSLEIHTAPVNVISSL